MVPETIAHYRITAKLGAGGMGEVYRATDTRLGREVAIKILPESFASDPARMARFEREAKVLAALNHPNIAAIYGVEERALIMELVEGETLAGPLPVETALEYTRQIAEALESTHEKGIIHRDLKPANVKVTSQGVVKVLDFGLAAVEPPAAGDASNSPTLTLGATEVGMLLGTAAYMSPEQAAGKPVDKRADIWSFGVVLWELLTGQRLFHGETVSHTLADVLRAPIEFEKLPEETPASVRQLLRRCLDRDVRNRLRDIGEARLLLQSGPVRVQAQETTPSRSGPRILPWVVASLLAATAAGLGFVAFGHFTEQTTIVRFSVPPPEKGQFATSVGTGFAVSPDGSKVAFIVTGGDGRAEIWVRDLDSFSMRRLPGTEGALGSPFWSPDTRTLAFFANGKLQKIDTAGGPPITICSADPGRSGSWSDKDIIVFQPGGQGRLYRVPAAGGTPAPVTTLDPAFLQVAHRFPWFLPDGKHFLFTVQSKDSGKNGVYLGDVESRGEVNNQRLLLAGTTNAAFFPGGRLLFMRGSTLMAQKLDAASGALSGEAVPVADQVNYSAVNARGQFSVSQNPRRPVLAYLPIDGRLGLSLLTWFDRSGKALGTVGVPAAIQWAAISPDGLSIAMDRPATDDLNLNGDIWLHDMARGTTSRFTFSGMARFPSWSPDGVRIAFLAGVSPGIYQKPSSGVGQEQILDGSTSFRRVDDWSPDGRYLIEEAAASSNTGSDIWVAPLFGDRKPYAYLNSAFNERDARISPDGQWLAYDSDENRRTELYVVTFPMPGGKWQISTEGGRFPCWSHDGKELFFIGADGKLMAVDVKAGARFNAGTPKPLFDAHMGAGVTRFDVNREGRFLIPVRVEDAASPPMNIVVNWSAGLKK